MGYRSDVTIGITKVLYLKAILLNNIPKALEDVNKKETSHNIYWQIQGWKWYDSYPEIKEILDWFKWCEEESETDETYETHFGALRLGEDYGDSEEWGSPYDFDIYKDHNISSPF